MPVKVVALVTVKPGEDEAFVAAAGPCVAALRAEPGVLHYDLWREAEGEHRFVSTSSTSTTPPSKRRWPRTT
jgi:quinol monooxygenase YgiN